MVSRLEILWFATLGQNGYLRGLKTEEDDVAYDALDYYLLNDLYTEEERLIQQTVREFVNDNLMPIIEHCNRDGRFPRELVAKAGELGLIGAPYPEKYGCANLGPIAYGLINQETERGDSGFRSFISVQTSLVMYPIFAFGSEAQKDHWLPKLATGEKIGCFGLTEPDFGSNPGGMLTRAVEKGSHYVLNGSKAWITNGTISDVAIVWGKLDGEVRGFIVETDRPGFSAPEIKNKFSLRASVTSDLILQDVEIPKENILAGVKGLKGPLSCLSQARYGIAWGANGAAMAVYDEVLKYAQSRIQFDKPIASFQLVQNKLVWMATEITKGQLLAYRLGQLKDSGKLRPQQVSMAKRNNVGRALEIARVGRDILGANGISNEYSTFRHMNNLESVNTYEGTYDIHTLIIGEDLTGIAAYA
ncbi:acyl-CoA dehydrogenase family protein [candidate division KSB1 bacterium]|nr:acyl-CoA dehydrogenase family protein [candidate division KSB1 bacterium]